MIFLPNEDETRFVDSERARELIRDDAPTGSSGYLSFKLISPKFTQQFYAKLTSVASLDGSDDPADQERLVWLVFGILYSSEPELETKQKQIEDVMVQFKSWFGFGQENWTYQVRFGYEEGHPQS